VQLTKGLLGEIVPNNERAFAVVRAKKGFRVRQLARPSGATFYGTLGKTVIRLFSASSPRVLRRILW